MVKLLVGCAEFIVLFDFLQGRKANSSSTWFSLADFWTSLPHFPCHPSFPA